MKGINNVSGKKLLISLLMSFLFLCLFSVTVFAKNEKAEVPGKFYEFKKDNNYEFDKKEKFEKTTNDNTYGSLIISGNVITTNETSDVQSYEIVGDELKIFYNHGDDMLKAGKDSWHLSDDKSKKISDIKLESNVGKGTIIVQTSKDRKNWITDKIIYNDFEKKPVRTKAIYSAKDVQLINGCYYRIIVAYKLSIRTKKSNILFINTDKYDTKKCAEVYEFYVYKRSDENNIADANQIYRLGTKVRSKKFDGYFGEESIDKSDAHYGWELGEFFVDGYTDEVIDDDGNVVFLKNVGDKVTLWFKLNQNIDKLNNKDNLSITADTEGYDQYFETPKTNFGRGTLIIRYTDHNNVKAEPTIYTNYLEANAVVGADTKVQLFEEGDYEVALDYEVTKDELIDKVGHYRIFFKFSVRNGNCMVYPFDVETGDELTNSAMTETGFRLDLAKSRYLKINIKRETLTESADGLVEDTRFNGPAKDGAEYTDEGIYTITISNEYTGQSTVKKIYVGENNILRAHVTTGLSIPEINTLVSDGATISEEGILQTSSSGSLDDASDDKDGDKIEKSTPFTIIVVTVILCIVIMIIILAVKKKKQQNEEGGYKK